MSLSENQMIFLDLLKAGRHTAVEIRDVTGWTVQQTLGVAVSLVRRGMILRNYKRGCYMLNEDYRPPEPKETEKVVIDTYLTPDQEYWLRSHYKRHQHSRGVLAKHLGKTRMEINQIILSLGLAR